jgi:hypothetical protein
MCNMISSEVKWFPRWLCRFLLRFTGFLMLLSVFWVFSGADVGCLGGYLIYSVITWGFLCGHMDFLGVYTGLLGVIWIS